MALNLRAGESIRAQARIHWSSYARPFVTGTLVAGLMLFCAIAYLVNNQDSRPVQALAFLPFAIAGFIPLCLRWMQNKAKKFIVTDQRIFLEEGVLAKFSSEIPLGKINDVSMHQGFLQRLVDSGDITVLTGNDITTSFTNIAQPDLIREAISQGR